MIGLECQRVRALIDARAGGLAEFDRLRLEAHLGRCERCAADADTLDAVRALMEPVPTLGDARLERVVASALRQAQQDDTVRPRALRTGLTFVGGGVALAAAAAVALIVVRPEAPPPRSLAPAVVASSPSPASAPAVRDDRPLAPAAQGLADGVEQTFDAPARVQVGHATVELAANTRVRWERDAATLHLLAGTADAQVDPAPKLPFRVATEHFVVAVTGTRFATSLQGVRVHEGSVRVEAPDGAVLRTSVSAGQRWTYVPEPEASASPSVDAVRDAVSWLSLARKRLAARDVDGARVALAKVLSGKASRIERAEALTLRAECALAQGRVAEALAGYRQVAQRYRDLPAGDNALFAAAGLAVRQGDTAQAGRLYARYLERYPDGRFATEASRALGRKRAAAASE